MFAIIGVVVVLGAVAGGYLMEHGKIAVLMQPAELLIIGGAAIGTLLIANPLPVLMRIVTAFAGILNGSPYTKAAYLDTLKMLNDLFMVARKAGMVKLEEDIENPEKSQVFLKYPAFLANHHAVAFVCDTVRMSISAGVPAFDLDQMMELDMEVHHHEASVPVQALSTTADALPGLGIVAAVLGVVITMGALGGPPEEIGHKVAAALVGTFLGILLCYGFLGPAASFMAKMNDAEADYYRCLRQGVIAFVKGSAPTIAVEFARRGIPSEVRPSFQEMEAACKGRGASAEEAPTEEAAA
ncbi:MAG TPA: flagellar motor stator protein MotA [Bryobacteraceae bacterium]|nr:flagellar motor stator protein MotA [Bryobacteraceae bacterium]